MSLDLDCRPSKLFTICGAHVHIRAARNVTSDLEAMAESLPNPALNRSLRQQTCDLTLERGLPVREAPDLHFVMARPRLRPNGMRVFDAEVDHLHTGEHHVLLQRVRIVARGGAWVQLKRRGPTVVAKLSPRDRTTQVALIDLGDAVPVGPALTK